MIENRKLRDILLKIVLFIGILAGIYSAYQQLTGRGTIPKVLEGVTDVRVVVYGVSAIIATFAGFFNIYFTSKRSKYFFIPDMIWLVASIITIVLSTIFSDLILYVWYLIVGVIQYFEWSRNEDDSGETKIKNFDKTAAYILLGGLAIAIGEMIILPLIGKAGDQLILGSFISGGGIAASLLLAKRYYTSEIIYFFINAMQVIQMLITGQYVMVIIPMVFFANTLIFLIFNKPPRNKKVS